MFLSPFLLPHMYRLDHRVLPWWASLLSFYLSLSLCISISQFLWFLSIRWLHRNWLSLWTTSLSNTRKKIEHLCHTQRSTVLNFQFYYANTLPKLERSGSNTIFAHIPASRRFAMCPAEYNCQLVPELTALIRFFLLFILLSEKSPHPWLVDPSLGDSRKI